MASLFSDGQCALMTLIDMSGFFIWEDVEPEPVEGPMFARPLDELKTRLKQLGAGRLCSDCPCEPHLSSGDVLDIYIDNADPSEGMPDSHKRMAFHGNELLFFDVLLWEHPEGGGPMLGCCSVHENVEMAVPRDQLPGQAEIRRPHLGVVISRTRMHARPPAKAELAAVKRFMTNRPGFGVLRVLAAATPTIAVFNVTTWRIGRMLSLRESRDPARFQPIPLVLFARRLEAQLDEREEPVPQGLEFLRMFLDWWEVLVERRFSSFAL